MSLIRLKKVFGWVTLGAWNVLAAPMLLLQFFQLGHYVFAECWMLPYQVQQNACFDAPANAKVFYGLDFVDAFGPIARIAFWSSIVLTCVYLGLKIAGSAYSLIVRRYA